MACPVAAAGLAAVGVRDLVFDIAAGGLRGAPGVAAGVVAQLDASLEPAGDLVESTGM